MLGLLPAQGCEKSRRKMQKHFLNYPMLNYLGRDHDEADESGDWMEMATMMMGVVLCTVTWFLTD